MDKTTQILLVDDEADVLEAYKMMLEESGYTVYTAQTCDEAMDVLESNHIALCLVDLKLKDQDGIDVSSELFKADPLLKIIIITAYPTYDSAVEAIKMGVFDYTSKTEAPRDLLDKIERALDVRSEEIAAKNVKSGKTQHNIVLICNHALVQAGLEHFCRENPVYRLSHSYRSTTFIKPADFNVQASLLLVCMSCFQNQKMNVDDSFSRYSQLFPNAGIVAINSDVDDDDKIALIKKGIMGFLPKNIERKNMKKAFDMILKGQFWVDRGVTSRLLAQLLESQAPGSFKKPTNQHNLSRREVEILRAMASGLSNFEISETYFISENTVKIHINHIFKKLKVKSRTQAVMKSQEAQII